MATLIVKTYRCDACGDKVPTPSALRRFYIEWGKAERYRTNRPGIRVELCTAKCVERFAVALQPFIGDPGVEAIVPPSINGSGETEDES